MVDQIDSNVPQEEMTTHNKKASFVALALVLIVTVGLVIQSFMNYLSRSSRNEDAQITQQKEVVKETASTEDFADEKERAERQISFDTAKKEEEARRKNALVEMGRDPSTGKPVKDAARGADPASSDDPYQEVYAEFQREEIKRVLKARQAGFRPDIKQDDSRKASGGGPYQKVNSAHTPERARIEVEQQRALSQREDIKRMNAQLNRQMAQLQKGMEISAGQSDLRPADYNNDATASEITGQKIVGEPIANRKESPNGDRGPRPGEVLLPTGTVLSAVLDMDMISDYDGPFRGLLVRDVYDVENKYVLFPKGTRIVGTTLRIQNINEPIQARMAMAVKWAILPNGNRIDFSKMAALDAAGVAALKDKVNHHILAQLLGLTAYGVLGAAPGLNIQGQGEPLSSQQQTTASITRGMRDQFSEFAKKYLNLVPTITIRAGTPFKIFVEDDLYIKPWSRVDTTIYTSGLFQ